MDLDDVPFDTVTVPKLIDRLNTVLTHNTRRKHAINLRAALGFKLPCPKPMAKEYNLPPFEAVHEALENSTYRMWGFAMIYAGCRLGESCVNQPVSGRTVNVDRQRLPDGSIAVAKTTGPVVVPEWFAEEYASHDFTRSHNTVYVGIRRAGKKAGLTLNPHMLRHLYGTRLVELGASPNVLQRQMRHHDVSVSLKFYVQIRPGQIEDLMDGF